MFAKKTINIDDACHKFGSIVVKYANHEVKAHICKDLFVQIFVRNYIFKKIIYNSNNNWTR